MALEEMNGICSQSKWNNRNYTDFVNISAYDENLLKSTIEIYYRVFAYKILE